MQKLWLICVGITCMAFLAMYALLSFYSQANEEPVSFVLHTFEGNDYASSKDPQFKLVFFGFTHCPDVCPTGLATMSKALSETVTPRRLRTCSARWAQTFQPPLNTPT